MGYYSNRMKEDMMIRNFSPVTQKAYITGMLKFIRFIKLAPEKINLENIRKYQLYLIKERHISYSYFNQQVCAIKFFYKHIIKRNWDMERIPYQKRPKTLPVVFSKKEVLMLLDVIKNKKHHAIALTMYATGARLKETINLKTTDIDSDRMVIHLKHGKGAKDRIVMLSPNLLKELRLYYKYSSLKPAKYLFPANNIQKPMSKRNVQYFIQKAIIKAGIQKKASSHTLRHSFATHLLEDGINIIKIQKLLGHRSLKTTSIYTHIAKDFVNETKSPLDTLLSIYKDDVGVEK